jgi:2-methylcitrate dehydratase PrpD
VSERSVTEQWGQFFLETPYERLPPDVVGHAKRALLDFLGVALGGASMPMARISAEYYADLGGKSEASLLLDERRVPAVNAAFVNGVYGHTLDMDDGHRLAGGHPGVATIPAALATAEVHAASGRELLRSIVFGYEVFVRIGAKLNPAHLRRGYHTTATVAPFAAAASGILMGLDAGRLTRALGLAGLQGAGLMEVFHDGAMAKPFQTGRASAAGLLAAELAARGAEGPRTILEGEQGFLGAMSGDRDASALVAGLGEDWAIRGIYFKEHAACRHTHAAVDAARMLQQAHDLGPEDVERAVVRTYSTANQLCGTTELPRGPSEAKFSLPFTVALGLRFGHARQSCFTPELVTDEGLRAVARRVSVVVDPRLEALLPQQRVSVLEITTHDGQTLSKEVPFPRGEPELPFSDADVEAKFLENAQTAISEAQARALAEQVWSIDTRPSCTELLDLLAGRATPALAAR